MTSGIKVVFQSDDFGMSHAGNEGVVRAFTEGVLTQASVMVACPWFLEAARLAKEHAIPVGVHLMATSEWDSYRWGPITGGRTLVGPDGRFHRSIAAARESVDPRELLAEFVAQVELFLSEGLTASYFDCHMGIVHLDAYAEICRRYGAPFDHAIGEVAVGFDSIHDMSRVRDETTIAYLVDRLGKLAPGKHLFYGHPAVDSPELRSLSFENETGRAWRNDYRPADLEALTSPEVREAVDRLGIELVSVADLR